MGNIARGLTCAGLCIATLAGCKSIGTRTAAVKPAQTEAAATQPASHDESPGLAAYRKYLESNPSNSDVYPLGLSSYGSSGGYGSSNYSGARPRRC